MAIDVGSSWWIQLFLWIAVNALFYGLIELWRNFPFISGYIVILVNLILLPFVFITDHTSFFEIKFFLICPVLIVITLFRLVYIPINDDTIFYKKWISKFARLLAKPCCCVTADDIEASKKRKALGIIPNSDRRYSNKTNANAEKCMEWFFCLVAWSNIMVAAIFGFFDSLGSIYLNSFAGIILAFSIPVPGKLLYNKHGYFINDEDDLYDGLGPIHWLWILTFTSWEWCYVWHYAPESVFTAALHLVPNGIRAFRQKRYDLWLQLRVFCLCVSLWAITPIELTTHPNTQWFLNANNFPWFINIATNRRWFFEVWGAFTLLAAIINAIIWIKWIITQRKLDRESSEKLANEMVITYSNDNDKPSYFTKQEKKTKKIVIIGAGPAGIHAYSLLCKRGWNKDNITILEKTNRTAGKAMTVSHNQTLPNGYTPVHELGTCYLHPEYFIIEKLFNEYDPDNIRLKIPSRGAFGTVLNENICNKADEKAVDFSDWAFHKAEKLVIPKAFHWIPNAISGGLAFYDAVIRYNAIHRKIFGEPNHSHGSHGFPSQPSPDDMKRIDMTFLEFLQKEDIEALIPFMVYAQTGQGYGQLDKIPAFYGLYWNTPELFKQVVDIFRLITDKPNVLVVKYGFQRLWNKMIEKHKMNVKLNINIKSVDRSLNNPSKKTKIYYTDTDADDDVKSDQKLQEIECDYLFLACGVKKSLSFLTDATAEEIEIFNTISPHTLCATLYEADVSPDKLHETVSETWPNIVLKGNGHLYAHRNSLGCLLGHDKFNELVIDGTLKRERSVAYQFLGRPPDKNNDPNNLENILKKDLKIWGETNVNIIKQECWDYFPVFSQDAINKGYPWKIKNEMQGKNKNTFYIGSSVCYESVLNVVEYNIELFEKHKF